MTTTEELLSRAKAVFMDTYPMQPVVQDHGDGCYLIDRDGKRYLDFAAGIAVASLGHNHAGLNKAIEDQIHKFMICPASYATEPRIRAAEMLVAECCCDKVFFSNSGAEAIEAAIKLARVWAHKNKGEEAKEIITFGKSFHGRTMGAVSITEKSRTYPEFGPYLPGVHFAEFNNLESVTPLISDKTCAIIVEPVQGEGGINPADKAFMKGLRDICDTHDLALIFDEVQCGMGRTGHLYCHAKYGVKGDMIVLAKGMGSGFPVGALLANDKFAAAFKPGMHGSTYGGNPVAGAVVCAVLDELKKPGFLDNVKAMGQRFKEGLERIKRESNKIEAVRAEGLMVGADLSVDIKAFLGALRDNGMLATQAGSNTLRLTPPLIAGEKEIDEALAKIEQTLKEF